MSVHYDRHPDRWVVADREPCAKTVNNAPSRNAAYDAPEMNATIREAIFGIGPQIRYIAFGEGTHRDRTTRRDRRRIRREL